MRSAREIDPTPNEERTLAIERFEPGAVDYAELTALIHRAYARLLADGFEYLAAVQSVEMTQLRVEAGTTFIARVNGRVIGTISYYPGTPHTRPYPEWYEREDVGFFGQFAVIPEMCGQGIGDRLLSRVERLARETGKGELACDTAKDVARLVRYYEDRGYRAVGLHRWPHARYDSVVLSKSLATTH